MDAVILLGMGLGDGGVPKAIGALCPTGNPAEEMPDYPVKVRNHQKIKIYESPNK